VVEDKTKRGLPVLESSIDDNAGIKVDMGRFYDANGRGHESTNKMVLSQGKIYTRSSL
jgi:hypothetical protein